MDGHWWEHPTVSTTSTTGGGQMGIILAALYCDPRELFDKAYQLLRMWNSNPPFVSQALAYVLNVHALINNTPLPVINKYLEDSVDKIDEIGNRMSSYDDLTVSETP